MSDLLKHDWGYVVLPTTTRASLQYTTLATRIASMPPGPQDGLLATPSETERGRRHRGPSQKTMLSNALQKANTAVLLDNAQNFEGAMDAYADACDLLQQVMQGSTADEDKRKLEAIVRLVLTIFDLNTDATSAQLIRTE
jgi:MIT (microtubule interacting and transport) domain